jgi:hypothetical protein
VGRGGEEVRVASPHLLLDLSGEVAGPEVAALLRQHDLEGDVQQEIAKFHPDGCRVPLTKGVVELEHLLHEVWPEGLRGLGPVPRTACAEISHEIHDASKR